MESTYQAKQHTEVKRKLKKEQRFIFLRKLYTNKLIVLGSTLMGFLLLVMIIGPFIVSNPPNEMIVENRFMAPSSEHLLGTDEFGRDLLSRIVHGTRVTLGVGLAVAILTSLFGMIIGLYASYYRFLDQLLMRISDGLMSIPAILLAIALMAALGATTKNVIIALTIVFTPHIARVIRSSALVIREQTYIEAIKSQGASNLRIIWFHIMPNTISPLIVQATFIFADAIITEAALSFLGAGVPPPDPSWGNILYDGKLSIFNAWWITVFSGLMIVISVLGLNVLGDGLRDLLDPNVKQSKKK